MALSLVERFAGDFDPETYEDRYRARLLEIVEEKRRGGEVTPARREEPKETPDLLTALQESLARYAKDAPKENRSSKDGLDALTVDELSARARTLGVSGRSKMSKRELVAAIEDAERRGSVVVDGANGVLGATVSDSEVNS
jgi:DNA end-binding protein Ku